MIIEKAAAGSPSERQQPVFIKKKNKKSLEM